MAFVIYSRVDICCCFASFIPLLCLRTGNAQVREGFIFYCCHGNCVGISITQNNGKKNKNIKERSVCQSRGMCVCLSESELGGEGKVRKIKSSCCSGSCGSAETIQSLYAAMTSVKCCTNISYVVRYNTASRIVYSIIFHPQGWSE